MWKRTLALVLIGCMSLGATFAGEQLSTNANGATCEWWGITGDTETVNLTDQCRGTQQSLQDDAATGGNAVCTHENVPTGFTSSKRSCDFDGAGDFLSIPDGSMGNWLSICAWVAPDQDGNQFIAGHYDAAPNPDTGVRLFAFDVNQFIVAKAYADGTNTQGPVTIAQANAWTFVGMTWDGTDDGTITLYNSGVSHGFSSIKDCDVGSGGCTESTSVYGDPAVDYLIGLQAGGTFSFAGQIGEVSAWGSELSAEEACQICRCGPSNQQNPANVEDVDANVNTRGDRLNECHACTLPTLSGAQVTHCGPRRIM